MTFTNYDQIPSGLSDDCFENLIVHHQNAYNQCIKNPKVYDEKGIFTPYSTIINTVEDHKALCSSRKINNNIALAKNDRR